MLKKRYIIPIVIIICVFTIISGCCSICHKKNINDPEIIPGKKLYNLFIDDPFSSCIKLYGRPNKAEMGECDRANMIVARYDNFEVLVTDINNNRRLDKSDTLWSINVYKSAKWDGRTAFGNGIGSSRNEITAEFGSYRLPLRTKEKYYQQKRWDYPFWGIGFFFFEEEDDDYCDMVTVQKSASKNMRVLRNKVSKSMPAKSGDKLEKPCPFVDIPIE